MLILRLLNFFAGYKKISCPAEKSTEIINLIVSNEIDYWEMKREKEGGVTFSLLNTEYKKLLSLMGEEREILKTEKNCGLPDIIYRYRKRIGVPIGLIMFFVFVKLSTMYVWDVTVSGNDKISDAEIIDSLESLGCSIGTYIPSVDFYNICHEFIIENEEISWISVNMVGTTARVEVIERRAKENIENDGNGTPTNLIAARDGVVVRVETARGKTAVQSGVAVKKGELLVSGVVDVGHNDSGEFVLVRSRGRVFAHTERVLEVKVPLKSVKKTFTGREKAYEYIKFFGKLIKVKENSSILDEVCDIIENKQRVILFEGGKLSGGVALPISYITGYKEQYTETEVTLTPDEALAVAKMEMSELYEKELSDAELLKKTEKYELSEADGEEVLVYIWNISCIENIAEEVPIGIS